MIRVIIYLNHSVSLESQEIDLAIYKGDQGTYLMLIMISKMAKGCIRLSQDLFIRKNDTRFNLGNHNILLETNYDLWA